MCRFPDQFPETDFPQRSGRDSADDHGTRTSWPHTTHQLIPRAHQGRLLRDFGHISRHIALGDKIGIDVDFVGPFLVHHRLDDKIGIDVDVLEPWIEVDCGGRGISRHCVPVSLHVSNS